MNMMKKTFCFLCVICCGLTILAYFQKNRFPPEAQIISELNQEPLQAETEAKPFKVAVNNVTYTITPQHTYELRGMVVSYLNSFSFLDYFHEQWQDYLNPKDVCVIWGENLRDKIYGNMTFKTQSWACSYRWPNSEVGSLFQRNQLSNNHLLTDNKILARRMKDVRKGDQIYLTGYLVTYSHDQGFRRGTSTTREDTGSGACETVWVTDFQILKKANRRWRGIFSFSLAGVAVFGLGMVFSKRDRFS